MLPNEPSSVAVSRCGSSHPGSDPVRTVVWVRGDHESATSATLAGTIAQAAGLDDADIIVDLSGVTFMDASTIGALVDAHNRLRANSRSLSVRAPSRLARRLLEVCGLAFLIDEHPAELTSTAALDSWVAVPMSDRAPESAQPPVTQEATAQVPEGATARRPTQPTGLVQQRRTPS